MHGFGKVEYIDIDYVRVIFFKKNGFFKSQLDI